MAIVSVEWASRGLKLKKARESRDLYLKDVAKIINKSVGSMCDYEQGRKRMDFDDLKTLCVFYGIDIRTF